MSTAAEAATRRRTFGEFLELAEWCWRSWLEHVHSRPGTGTSSCYVLQTWIGEWCDREDLVRDMDAVEARALMAYMEASAGHRRAQRPRSVLGRDDKQNRIVVGMTTDAKERELDPTGRSQESLRLL